jgi:hypothetical protein
VAADGYQNTDLALDGRFRRGRLRNTGKTDGENHENSKNVESHDGTPK